MAGGVEVGSMKSFLSMCYDWRVLAGLAGVAVWVWIVAPELILGVLPLLLLAACPLSMVVMVWMMRGQHAGPGTMDPQTRLAALEHEQARLAAEVARARAEAAAASPAETDRMPERARSS